MELKFIKMGLIILLFSSASCNSQKVDLTKITFSEGIKSLFQNVKYEVDKTDPFFPQMTVYKTIDKTFLRYDDIDLTNATDDIYSQNSILFVTENDIDTIKAMGIESVEKENNLKLYKNLVNRYGKGSILSNTIHNEADEVTMGSISYLWEDMDAQNTYILCNMFFREDGKQAENVLVFVFKNDFRLRARFIRSFSHTLLP